MLPKYLKVQGFRSYIDTTIDFTSFGNIFCVIGENGAGKSSIIEMISTALYWCNSCTDAKGSGMDECINSNCNSFTIEFCFVMNGIEYIVNTSKTRGESRTLDFYINGVNQSEKVSETQEKINSILKMNYDTFMDTVCIGQGASSRFMNKKPAERKQTLMQILDVQKFEDYENKAKEKKKQIKDELDSLKYKIDILEDSSIDIFTVEESINNDKKELKSKERELVKLKKDLEAIQKEKIEYENNIQRQQELQKSIVAAKNQMERNTDKKNELEKRINEISPNLPIVIEDTDLLEKQLEEIKKSIDTIKEDISDKKSILAVIDNKLNDYRSKYNRFVDYNESVCELCGNKITDEHKESHLAILKKSIDNGEKKRTEVVNIIDSLNSKGKSLVGDGKTLQQTISSIQRSNAIKYDLQKEYDYVHKQYDEYIELVKESTEQYDSLKGLVVNIEKKTFNDDELKNAIFNIESTITSLKNDIAKNTQLLETHQKNKDKIKEIEKRVKILKEQQTDYTSIITAFGKNGIPASIISHDIPEMEDEVNKILKIISNDTMSIQYITTKNGKKKSVDTLEIVVSDGNTSRMYETYSGGEKFRIDFACHIGMAKFLTKRAGASIDFLIIDEGLGSQDDFSKQKFVESIMSLNGLFKQIMVVTHIQDLQNVFDNRILVQKNQLTGSYVEKM
jgi:SMC domain protein